MDTMIEINAFESTPYCITYFLNKSGYRKYQRYFWENRWSENKFSPADK